jgi:hypothetical protein
VGGVLGSSLVGSHRFSSGGGYKGLVAKMVRYSDWGLGNGAWMDGG